MARMNEHDRLSEINNKLKTNAYWATPNARLDAGDDMAYLLSLMDEKNQKMQQLEKKTKVLHQQNMELMQEMEMIKSDFGGDTR